MSATPFLNDQHRAVQEMVRGFAEKEIRPIAAELDDTSAYPGELYKKMASLGIAGVTVPEELGGMGADVMTYAIIMEELSRGYASVADQFGLIELIGTLMTQHGTKEQQDRYLRPLLQGRAALRLCADRGRGGLRPRRPQDHGREAAGRQLGAERRQAVDPQRAGRRFRLRADAHRQGGGSSRHVDLRRRPRPSGLFESASRKTRWASAPARSARCISTT